MVSVSQDLVNRAQTLRPDKCNIFHGCLVQLLEIAKGDTTDPLDVVAAARQASKSRSQSSLKEASSNHRPWTGAKASKEGRPRQTIIVSAVLARNGGTAPKQGNKAPSKCGFCKDVASGNVQNCEKLRAIGMRLKPNDVVKFVREALLVSKATFSASKLSELVAANKPMLKNFPTGTKWLLVSGLYLLNDSNGGRAEEVNVRVHVSCYGDMGALMPSLGPGSADFGDRMAEYTTVRSWISKCAEKSPGRLIIGREFSWR
mmetsp:Transcript_23179/g.38361  ORF Transcript_23179/g.38361 Transcript_23179/m.38361 type:complete len:259 (-) Transcript_23179:49-825(-)